MSAGLLELRAPPGELSPYEIGTGFDLELEPGDVHREAREVIRQGFALALGYNGTGPELQVAQAVGRRESSYGRGWKADGVGSNNWGAVQAGRPPCNPATSFEYTDTHPESDGSSTKYSICFRRYASPVEGAADMIRHLYVKRPTVLRAVHRGSLHDFSAAMYDEHYYEGFGATREARIKNHMKWIESALEPIAEAVGEPVYLNGPPRRAGFGLFGVLLLGGVAVGAIRALSRRKAA